METNKNKTIIEKIRFRTQNGNKLTDMGSVTGSRVFPTAPFVSVIKAEEKLGFQLPSLLRDIYTQVANGGFGPGYGLIGLDDGARDDQGHSITDLYFLNRGMASIDPRWYWPELLVPICHWGCAISSCIDCSLPDAPVVVFDPNQWDDNKELKDAFISHMTSFSQWIEAWLNGVDLWKHLLFETPLDHQLTRLLREGKKISAIVLYQKEKLCSLDEAKRYIDLLETQDQSE